jgi:hypothetical protein
LRFEDRVDLIVQKVAKYNPVTEKKESVEKILPNIPCNSSALSRERVLAEFGEAYKDITVVRFNHELDVIPTHALLRDRRYRVADVRTYRHKTSIYLHEELLNEN